MKERYFIDFKLGNHRLSDFNGIRYNPEDELDGGTTPAPRHTTIEIPNIHGSQYYKTTYDSKIITVPVFIYDDIDIEKFYAWICKADQQMFCYVDETGALDYKEIPVVYNQSLNFKERWYDGFKGHTDIEFIAYDPLWRIRDEKTILLNSFKLGEPKGFKTKTSLESTPIMKITPASQQDTIRFMINDLIITISDITKEIYINSQDGEVYELDNGIKINKFSKYYSNGWMDLPKIKPFEYNYISVIEGDIQSIEITPNSRILY